MIEITFKDVENKVRELVAEKPEFVYDKGWHVSCQYNPDDEQPGCIFGQVFIALGRPVPEKLEGDPVSDVFNEFGIKTTQDEHFWSSRLQMRQDDGETWEHALKIADARVEFLPA